LPAEEDLGSNDCKENVIETPLNPTLKKTNEQTKEVASKSSMTEKPSQSVGNCSVNADKSNSCMNKLLSLLSSSSFLSESIQPWESKHLQ
jgi:hypothetical protein